MGLPLGHSKAVARLSAVVKADWMLTTWHDLEDRTSWAILPWEAVMTLFIPIRAKGNPTFQKLQPISQVFSWPLLNLKKKNKGMFSQNVKWNREVRNDPSFLHFRFFVNMSLSSGSGEGNGNPLQYSCLENSTDGGVWGATVHGVQGVGPNRQLTHSHTLRLTPFLPGSGACGFARQPSPSLNSSSWYRARTHMELGSATRAFPSGLLENGRWSAIPPPQDNVLSTFYFIFSSTPVIQNKHFKGSQLFFRLPDWNIPHFYLALHQTLSSLSKCWICTLTWTLSEDPSIVIFLNWHHCL